MQDAEDDPLQIGVDEIETQCVDDWAGLIFRIDIQYLRKIDASPADQRLHAVQTQLPPRNFVREIPAIESDIPADIQSWRWN